jgi:hypothetical protein
MLPFACVYTRRYGNCGTLSNRDAFTAELMRHFPVDAPGKCLRNMDEAEALADTWASHVDVRHYDGARELAGRCVPNKPLGGGAYDAPQGMQRAA